MEDHEIQRADPRARRRVLAIVAVAVVAGVVGVMAMNEWGQRLRESAARDPQSAVDQAARLLRITSAVISVSLAALGLVVARLSLKVWRARRFPPPGSAVLVDTLVLTGRRARQRAILGFALAALLGGSGIILPYALWRVLHLLGPGA